jgi:aspartyl-tRNA(Asn)/glutamyl-tRNA(Gln) amidotransferase subunit A
MFGEIADIIIEGSSLAGLTGINVPVGLINGLPVGMQLVANHFKEQTILNVAYAYEQTNDWKANTL